MTKNHFKCSFCDSELKTKFSLKTHVDSIHENIKVGCHECGKQFGRKANLTTHINSVHQGAKL